MDVALPQLSLDLGSTKSIVLGQLEPAKQSQLHSITGIVEDVYEIVIKLFKLFVGKNGLVNHRFLDAHG